MLASNAASETFAVLCEQEEPSTSSMPNQNARFYLMDTDGVMQHMKGSEIVNLSSDDSVAIHQVRSAAHMFITSQIMK